MSEALKYNPDEQKRQALEPVDPFPQIPEEYLEDYKNGPNAGGEVYYQGIGKEADSRSVQGGADTSDPNNEVKGFGGGFQEFERKVKEAKSNAPNNSPVRKGHWSNSEGKGHGRYRRYK